jgi:hypothetical protein
MIYITDLGDPVFFPEKVAQAVHSGNPTILITKDPEKLYLILMGLHPNKEKLLIQVTITGLGSTIWEPNVPSITSALEYVKELLDAGFKVALRFDPIIPGINSSDEYMRDYLEQVKDLPILGITTSVVDLYPHAKKRITEAGLELPFAGFESIGATALLQRFITLANRVGVLVRVCCEAGFEAARGGCDWPDTIADIKGLPPGCQRKNCGCPHYTQLITYADVHAHPCPHKCLYCYIKW